MMEGSENLSWPRYLIVLPDGRTAPAPVIIDHHPHLRRFIMTGTIGAHKGEVNAFGALVSPPVPCH